MKTKVFLVGFLALFIVLLVACATPTPRVMTREAVKGVTAQPIFSDGYNRGYRFIDTEACVVCWYILGSEKAGISCLPASETTLDLGCSQKEQGK